MNMKRIVIYTAAVLAGLTLSCCQRAGMGDPVEESFRLRVGVDGITTGLAAETRSPVASVEGEDNVADLHLLFFEQSGDGSGVFVQDYQIPTPVVGSPTDLKIGVGAGDRLSNSRDYNILAFANLGDKADAFLQGIAGMTEKEASEKFLRIGTSDAFSAEGLPMSGSTVKRKDQQLVELTLSRIVCRFDVDNAANATHDLVSVSVFNASARMRVWERGDTSDEQTYIPGKFYGKEYGDSRVKVAGGLYAPENFTADPAADPDKVTSLVIGLRSKSEPSSAPMYYKVAVHPDDSGQNLKRNHVYNVKLNAVLLDGAAEEKDAAQGGLDVAINNWNMDEDGLVLTDGENILAIPSKYIRFGPDAGSREYEIFTHGQGTLRIIDASPSPDWVAVTLSGNTLKVSVKALPDMNERTASFEIEFGTLRGKVEVIQSPVDENYIRLTPGTIPMFGWNAGESAESVPVSVSASGEWEAVIYNMEKDGAGFSFEGGGKETLTWSSDKDGAFDVHVLDDNPKKYVIRGFIVASLTANPEYKQVIMLSQDSRLQIQVSPDYADMHFDVTGKPYDIADNKYVIDVTPANNKNGDQRPWEVELEGADAQYFDLSADPADPQRFILTAKGNNNKYPGFNLTKDILSKVNLRIAHTDVANPEEGVDYVSIPVRQDKLDFKIERAGGGVSVVPVKGSMRDGVYQDCVGYRITLNPQLTWIAEIKDHSHINENMVKDKPWIDHRAFFISKDNTTRYEKSSPAISTADDDLIRIGFDKLYYPLINVTPTANIRIKIAELDDISYRIVFSVKQTKLEPRAMKVQSYQSGYGSLGTTGEGEINATGRYIPYLMSSHLFSDDGNSMVKTTGEITKAPNYINATAGGAGVIENGVSYVHLNTSGTITSGHVTNIKTWWESDDRNLLVTSQEYNTNSTIIYTRIIAAKGYEGDGGNASPAYVCRQSMDEKKRAMSFMIQDGPATRGDKIEDPNSMSFTDDGTSSGLTAWPAYAVPILQSGNNTDPTHMSIVVDPVNNFIFYGEMQNFNSITPSPPGNLPGTEWSSKGRFLANLLAYVVNASQYGSHFTDMFIQLKPGDPGYDEKAEADRVRRYENAKKYWQSNVPEKW